MLAKAIVLKRVLYQFYFEICVEFIEKASIHRRGRCLERLLFARPIGSKIEVLCASVNSLWNSTQAFYVPFLKSENINLLELFQI